MYETPSESVVDVLWHMFGSFVLLSGLVVATAAAEERAEAFTVPLEAVVAFETGSVAAVGAGAVGATIVCRPGSSESLGCSAEKSSARPLVSIQHVDGAMTIWSMVTYHPAAG